MFQVKQKFDIRGFASIVGTFNDEKTARADIQKRLADDASKSIKAFYVLFDGADEMETFNPMAAASSQHASSDNESQQSGKGSSQSFRPTPLPTAPRPKGMPPSSWTRPDEDENKDK